MSFAAHIEAMDRKVLTHLQTGEIISFQSGAGDSVIVSALFDNAYEFVGVGFAGASSVSPAVFCRYEDLRILLVTEVDEEAILAEDEEPLTVSDDPDIDENARVFVDSVQYQVRETMPDGKGGVILKLHKVRL
jgi:hypothetical protein